MSIGRVCQRNFWNALLKRKYNGGDLIKYTFKWQLAV